MSEHRDQVAAALHDIVVDVCLNDGPDDTVYDYADRIVERFVAAVPALSAIGGLDEALASEVARAIVAMFNAAGQGQRAHSQALDDALASVRRAAALAQQTTERSEPLDVERLARALFRGDIGCEGHGHRTRHMASDHREDAEFIAAEYARLAEQGEQG